MSGWNGTAERSDHRKWTPALVKDSLPDVRIEWDGKPWQARVTGRLNEFASVSPMFDLTDRRKCPRQVMGPIFHFSWATIADALNGGRTLRA